MVVFCFVLFFSLRYKRSYSPGIEREYPASNKNSAYDSKGSWPLVTSASSAQSNRHCIVLQSITTLPCWGVEPTEINLLYLKTWGSFERSPLQETCCEMSRCKCKEVSGLVNRSDSCYSYSRNTEQGQKECHSFNISRKKLTIFGCMDNYSHVWILSSHVLNIIDKHYFRDSAVKKTHILCTSFIKFSLVYARRVNNVYNKWGRFITSLWKHFERLFRT